MRSPFSRRHLLAALLSLGLMPWSRPAAALEPPTGKVLLTLSGRLQHRNQGDQADFDDAMLAALPQHSITTRTPWDVHPRRFTGPLLRDLLAAVGAHGEQMQATALNDYRVLIPVADAQQHAVVVARLVDDQPVRVRERGPLLIVYPFDTDERLRDGAYVARSVWQLRRLDIR